MTARAPAALRRAIGGLAFEGLLRSSGWVLAGAVVARGATLVAGIVVARIIAPGEFGRMTVMLTAINLLSGIAGIGLQLAITRQVAEVRARRPQLAGRYVGSAMTLTALGGLLVAGVFVAGQDTFARLLLQDSGRSDLVVASAGAVLFVALNVAMQGALTGFESFRRYATTQFVLGATAGTGMIVGAKLGGAAGALAGFSIGHAATAVVVLLVLLRTTEEAGIRPSFRIWPEEMRDLLRYGLPTFGSFLAVAAALLGGQLILSHQKDGYEQVALFSIAYRWHLAVLFVPACIGPVLVPLIARLRAEGRGNDVVSIFRSTLLGTLVLAGVPALVVAVAAPMFLGLSGDFYADNPLPLVILAVTAIPAALNNVMSTAAVGLGAMKAWLVSDIALAVVVLGATALLVGDLRAEGLAIAYLAGYVATDLTLVRPLMSRLRG